MTWLELRAEFERLFLQAKLRGDTQRSVAKRGGLKEQNAISKLLSNRNLGPQAETFIRAIEGLGLRPSEFFRQLESSGTHDLMRPLQKNVSGRGGDDKRTAALTHEGIHGPAVPIADVRIAVAQVLVDALRQIGPGFEGLSLPEPTSEVQQSRKPIGRTRGKKSSTR